MPRDRSDQLCGEWDEEGLAAWHDRSNSVVFVSHLRRGLGFLLKDPEAVEMARVVQRSYLVARRAGNPDLPGELNLDEGACATEISDPSDQINARVCVLTGDTCLSLKDRKMTIDFDREELRNLARLTLDVVSHLSVEHGVRLT